MKIVILDAYSVTQGDLDWSLLRTACPDADISVYDRTPPAEVMARCADADVVLTNKVVLSADIMRQMPRLKYVGVLATGYNVVDIDAARALGICVTNIPSYSTMSVAQMVFAHILNVTNSVAHYAARRSQWPSSADFMWMDTPLTELASKSIGIYGLGAIGSAVMHIALAFGMNVLAVTSKDRDSLPAGVTPLSLEEMLPQADFITLHCPLTASTRAMINAETLRAMRPTAVLINTGRGPLVDEQAVADALSQNRLGAYCTDVLSSEPPRPDNPLLTAPRCYITPHIAWATHEARERLIKIATHNITAFMEHRPVNCVS